MNRTSRSGLITISKCPLLLVVGRADVERLFQILITISKCLLLLVVGRADVERLFQI